MKAGKTYTAQMERLTDGILDQWVKEGFVKEHERRYPQNREMARSAARLCLDLEEAGQ